eukprot:5344661-Pyramimonas_sp.AAC.1
MKLTVDRHGGMVKFMMLVDGHTWVMVMMVDGHDGIVTVMPMVMFIKTEGVISFSLLCLLRGEGR